MAALALVDCSGGLRRLLIGDRSPPPDDTPGAQLSCPDEGGRLNGSALVTAIRSGRPMADRPPLHQPHFGGYDRAE